MGSDKVIRDIIKNRGLILAVSRLDDQKATQRIVDYLHRLSQEETKVISLIGGAASGKSALARRVAGVLKNAAVISTDDFVLGSREYRRRYLEGGDPRKKYSFDLLREKVHQIKNLPLGESASVPVYNEKDGTGIRIIDFDSKTGQILAIEKNHYPTRIEKVQFLIVEGDFQPLANPDYQIFFHVPDEVRLQTRIDRDVKQRDAPSLEDIVKNFELRQKLQHRPYTLPCAKSADMLIMVRVVRADTRYEYTYSFWTCPPKQADTAGQ